MRLTASLLLVLSVASAVPAQEAASSQRGFHPVRVGKGPTLLVWTYGSEEERGPIYAVNPFTKAAQIVWNQSGRFGPSPRSWVRLDRNRVLLEYDQRLRLLTWSTGRTRLLRPEQRETELLLVTPQRALFLEYTKPRTLSGTRLKTRDGKTVTVGYPRSRMRLFELPMGSATPNRLGDVELEHVLEFRNDEVWAITAEATPHLVSISAKGAARRVVPLGSNWVVPYARADFSADGAYVALDLTDRNHDFHTERTLLIVDTAAGRITYRKDRLAPVIRTWGSQPPLSMWWAAKHQLVVLPGLLIDAASGRPLAMEGATPFWEDRPDAAPLVRPALDGLCLSQRWTGFEPEPPEVEGLDAQDAVVSPCERWIAYGKDDRVHLHDRLTDTTTALGLKANLVDLGWLDDGLDLLFEEAAQRRQPWRPWRPWR